MNHPRLQVCSREWTWLTSVNSRAHQQTHRYDFRGAGSEHKNCKACGVLSHSYALLYAKKLHTSNIWLPKCSKFLTWQNLKVATRVSVTFFFIAVTGKKWNSLLFLFWSILHVFCWITKWGEFLWKSNSKNRNVSLKWSGMILFLCHTSRQIKAHYHWSPKLKPVTSG